MRKTVLITGSTDGIGLEAAKRLAAAGCRLILHGRSAGKLDAARLAIDAAGAGEGVDGLLADLSRMSGVEALAEAVLARGEPLDVLINNAGVFKLAAAQTADGLDARFAVNTLAPALLTRRLLRLIPSDGRILNLSSAAQAPVATETIGRFDGLGDGEAYAQSKLALTMWSAALAEELGPDGPAVIAVNPGSLLGTNIVREAYGVAGGDIGIGADILRRCALEARFADHSGEYFDNDSGRFAPPHPDALDPVKRGAVFKAIEALLVRAEA
jgi:NAD(P)-dependent dehydrogenase (short-subunit alcohol dehydrogenase family)